ncbi:hypothetical protein D3C73_1608960 [compost metagenome]
MFVVRSFVIRPFQLKWQIIVRYVYRSPVIGEGIIAVAAVARARAAVAASVPASACARVAADTFFSSLSAALAVG